MPHTGNLEHEPAPVVSLAAYRAQKRRAAHAAASDARRGAVIILLLLVAGLMAGYTLHREQRLLDAGRVHHLP
jgi:hypothetical protein